MIEGACRHLVNQESLFALHGRNLMNSPRCVGGEPGDDLTVAQHDRVVGGSACDPVHIGVVPDEFLQCRGKGSPGAISDPADAPCLRGAAEQYLLIDGRLDLDDRSYSA